MLRDGVDKTRALFLQAKWQLFQRVDNLLETSLNNLQGGEFHLYPCQLISLNSCIYRPALSGQTLLIRKRVTAREPIHSA